MRETNNEWSQESYIKAYRFAAEKHKEQKVPGTDWSYLAHLSMVSMEIMAALNHEIDMDGNLAVQAAILHDTIEDADSTYEELLSEFGQKVADGVQALTKKENIEKQDQMSDSLRRIKLQPIEIWMVKMADRIIKKRRLITFFMFLDWHLLRHPNLSYQRRQLHRSQVCPMVKLF